MLLAVICKCDSTCFNEDVFLSKCLKRYGLDDQKDTKVDTLIRGWGETTSPFISRHLQDISSSSISQRFNKIANDVKSINNLHLTLS